MTFQEKAESIKWVKNTKSGNLGQVVEAYARTRDGKQMVQVRTITGLKAFWEARHVIDFN